MRTHTRYTVRELEEFCLRAKDHEQISQAYDWICNNVDEDWLYDLLITDLEATEQLIIDREKGRI